MMFETALAKILFLVTCNILVKFILYKFNFKGDKTISENVAAIKHREIALIFVATTIFVLYLFYKAVFYELLRIDIAIALGLFFTFQTSLWPYSIRHIGLLLLTVILLLMRSVIYNSALYCSTEALCPLGIPVYLAFLGILTIGFIFKLNFLRQVDLFTLLLF